MREGNPSVPQGTQETIFCGSLDILVSCLSFTKACSLQNCKTSRVTTRLLSTIKYIARTSQVTKGVIPNSFEMGMLN